MASSKRLKLTSSSSAAEPVKSLLKFKCVSKHWLSLISNPHFSRRRFLPHSPCICGFFLHDGPRPAHHFSFASLQCHHSKTLSSVSNPPDMKIVQSCNGLLLCRDIQYRPEPMDSVYNPTTRQCTTLPPLSQTGEISGGFLAFDPLKSTEYKVICFLHKEIEKLDCEIWIYSSKNGNWRASEARLDIGLDNGMHGGVFWNGWIHWYTDFDPFLYFDVEEEQIKEMPMPNPMPDPDDSYRRRVRYFGESRGHLHLVEFCHPPSTQFDVWELHKDYSGWSLKYRVNLNELVREYPGMTGVYTETLELYHVFEIFCIVEGETEEESYMVLHIPGNIIRYDFVTRNVRKISDFPRLADHRNDEDAEKFYYSRAYKYIESLVRV